jgi:hypothetical protein
MPVDGSIVLDNIYYFVLRDIYKNIQELQDKTEDGRREEAALLDRDRDYQVWMLISFRVKMINRQS